MDHTLALGTVFNLQADAEKSLRKPAFVALWPQMKGEFLFNPTFVVYVERV